MQFLFNLNLKEILTSYNWFLIIGVLFWVLIAVIQDFRKREVANWWNFSLIVFILAYRFFLSIELANWGFFVWGLIGVVVGFILANIFYYARVFAGGDAKLLIALGAFLPLTNNFNQNIWIFCLFIFFFILAGSIYGLIYSLTLMFLHLGKFKKSFIISFSKYKIQTLSSILFFAIVFGVFFLFNLAIGMILAGVMIILPILLLAAKAIEESCLTKFVPVSNLTIGDWLTTKVKIGKKIIKPNWEGLSEEELKIITKRFGKNKKVEIKYGIPFTPAFLFAILLLILLAML